MPCGTVCGWVGLSACSPRNFQFTFRSDSRTQSKLDALVMLVHNIQRTGAGAHRIAFARDEDLLPTLEASPLLASRIASATQMQTPQNPKVLSIDSLFHARCLNTRTKRCFPVKLKVTWLQILENLHWVIPLRYSP